MRSKRRGKEEGLFLSFIFAIFCVVVLFLSGMIENNYSVNGVVKQTEGDFIVVEDTTEKVWKWKSKEKEFKEGDKVRMIFFNATTHETREDDVLKRVKKVEE